ncbi:aspartate/glutamate racemase family protein [Gluconobacter sp.]|uniref:aspartate/glutamate racemase family protein n=1 Tax=Gluconobacter sp. TaxID=1876758 RepID=UPI0039EB7941
MNTRPETDPTRHLLILNPNTDQKLTAKLVSHARNLLPDSYTVDGVTARLGARYIACRTSHVIAAYATLDAFAHASRKSASALRPDTTILVACFGDPGLDALSDIARCSVTGMARASLLGCRAKGGRTGIVTGGKAWGPMLANLVATEGFTDSVAGIRTTPDSGERASLQHAQTVQALLSVSRDLIEKEGADQILIGGAGMIGFRSELAACLPVPVYCSFEESLASIVSRPPVPGGGLNAPLAVNNLGSDLASLLLEG